MLSKSQISFIKSLHQKKYRKIHQLFIVEGLKSISEFIYSDYIPHSIYATSDIFPKLANLSHKQKVFEATVHELTKISTLQHPQSVLAVFQIPKNTPFEVQKANSLSLVLDGIQDPGNLGTIIRTADWFGFNHIICSENTVEAYNPKVVQASMGSLSRINIYQEDLKALLSHNKLPVYGTLLDGENIFNTVWPTKGFLIFGSEGNGISEGIIPLISHPVTIPGNGKTESLNVAVSAAICMAELRRNILK